MKYSLGLFLLLCVALMHGHAQRKYSILVDGKGQLMPDLPERLYGKDSLSFHFVDPGESIDKYKKQLTGQAKMAIVNMENLLKDTIKLEILKLIYDIDSSDINKVLQELKAIARDPQADVILVPTFKSVSPAYFNIRLMDAVNTTQDVKPNQQSSSLPVKLSPYQTQLSFLLSKTDPYKKLVLDWLDKTDTTFQAELDTTGFSVYKEELKQQVIVAKKFVEQAKGFLDALEMRIENDSAYKFTANDTLGLIQTMTTIITISNNLSVVLGRISNATEPLKKNKQWILNWLWYQDQNKTLPALNPFGFRRPEDLPAEPDTSKLNGLRMRIAIREQFYSKLDYKKIRMSQIDSLIHEIDTLKKNVVDIEGKYKTYLKVTGNNDGAIKNFSTTARLLNKGELLVSESGNLTLWMRHHDAQNNNQLMNGTGTDEYLEKDRVVVMGHNLREGEEVAINIQFKDITNDQSQLSEEVAGVLDQLEQMSGIFGGNQLLQTMAANEGEQIKGISFQLLWLQASLMLAVQYDAALTYLSTQHNPHLKIKATTDESNAYHSAIVNPAKKIDGPKQATYYLTKKSTAKEGAKPESPAAVADTFQYRVNKLYRIFPMAGLAYTFTPFANITYDSATGQHQRSNENPLHFLVGVKIFLRKTDIRNSKLIWQKDDNGQLLLLSRTSVSIAVDVKNPLSNMYGGIGFDLIPGACINAGVHLNRYTYNQYANKEITQSREKYRAGFYIGLSTDISLFADLAKFLNLAN